MGKIVTKTCSTAISSIVYITDKNLLNSCLATLSRSQPNVEYLYCIHKGENGDKDHTHLLLNTRSDKFNNCDKIRDYFIVDNEEKSLCTHFEQTKSLGDWYKYAYHDKPYLDSKHESKEFYYTESDVIGSDNLRSLCLSDFKYRENKSSESPYQIVINGLSEGLSDLEILEQMPCTDAQDYVSSLRLIDEVKKRTYKNEYDKKEMLDKLLCAHLMNNPTYQNLSSANTYRVLNNHNSIVGDVLNVLEKIDLVDLLMKA